MCDFMLQSDWMALNKSGPGKEGYRALLLHAGIHACGTFIIMMLFAPSFWWLSLVDFAVHSFIDRFKGRLTKQNDWNAQDTYFRWALGADQELHNFTHLLYIVIVVMHGGGIIS